MGGAYFIVQDENIINFSSSDPALSEATRSSMVNSHFSFKNGGTLGRANARLTSSQNLNRRASSFPLGKKGPAIPTESFKNMTGSDDDLPAHLSMYEQYAMVAQPVSSHTPARRMTPADDEFYPTVTIQALMRVFKDSSLAVHHGMVMQAIMFIFKSLGLRCVPFLNKVVPHVLVTIRTCGPTNLRESLLKQVATLSGIVREHLRPYVADIFDIVESFWTSRHLSTIFSLISHIAVGVPDEFKFFVPRLISLYLKSLDEIQIAEWLSIDIPAYQRQDIQEAERLRLILCSIRNLKSVLGNYLHVLVPALLKLSSALLPLISDGIASKDNVVTYTDLENLGVLMMQTTAVLLECEGTGSSNKLTTPYWGEKNSYSGNLSARIVQPLIRLLRDKCKSNKAVGLAVVDTICVCARQLGVKTWMQLYHSVVRIAIAEWQESVGFGSDDIESHDKSPSHTVAVEKRTALQHYDGIIEELEASRKRYLPGLG